MCHFITGTASATTDPALLRRVLGGHGLSRDPVDNAAVRERLPGGEAYFRLTSAHCDCGTFLGSAGPRGAGRAGDEERERRRLERREDRRRRRGWSEARIEAWKAELDRSALRAHRERALVADADRLAAAWVEAIRDVVRQPRLGALGVLLHWYGDTLEGEDLRFGVRRVRLADLVPATLTELPEDVLHVFVP